MSERKVLSKYYPPDFDPSKLTRQRGPKTGPKFETVRLMAPFSMKCTTCGEFIYKGRKFNARKEVTDERYYAIKIIRFYIRCTRCSAEITFKTDPKHTDYMCERGAKRNFEPWREAKLAEETEEERLDRLEREEAEKDKMQELETKVLDAKTEMEIADALDSIRTRNARIERGEKGGDIAIVRDERDLERERQEAEDEEAARRAFEGANGEKVRRLHDIEISLAEELPGPSTMISDLAESPQSFTTTTTASTASTASSAPTATTATTALTTFKKAAKKKVDYAAKLGIKKKPSLV